MDIAADTEQLLEFSSAKRVPLILQAEVAECGLASIAMVASYYGHQLDMPAMRKRFSANLKGMNLRQLIDLGDSLGLASRALKCSVEDVPKLTFPCVIHWDMNHFVVLTKVTKKKVFINDPAMGKKTLSIKEFSQHFTGIVLELTPTNKFEAKDEKFSLEKFAPFVHQNNIFQIMDALEDAEYHIERNGNAKIIFTDLSIKLTRLIHSKE